MAGVIESLVGFFSKGEEPYRCKAIIVAGGSSERMQGKDKLMLEIGGVPALARSVMAFDICPLVDEIVVVAREDRIVPYANICKNFSLSKVTRVVKGGDTRFKSVMAGLEAIPGSEFVVAVHDAARPLVNPADIERTIRAARSYNAAALAVPVTDTLKRAENGMIFETVERDALYAVQTPQVFDAAMLKGAYKKALEDGLYATDDCALVERMGLRVFIVEGSRNNIKLTTPGDYALACAIWDTEVKNI